MSKKRQTRRLSSVLTTESIQEGHQGDAPAVTTKPSDVLSSDSIVGLEPEQCEELEPEDPLPQEEDLPPMLEMVCNERRKLRGKDLGEQSRKVYKRNDPDATHEVELLLPDGAVYVMEFCQGVAAVPQGVAEHIQCNLRCFVVD